MWQNTLKLRICSFTTCTNCTRCLQALLLRGYSLEELEKHISLLHEYNDIKDAGQMLLGKLAVIRGVTTKQLYPEYDLELSD